jgi:hypothetical protein
LLVPKSMPTLVAFTVRVLERCAQSCRRCDNVPEVL